MITVANRIYVNREYAETFEERFRNRAGLVDGMPGFIANQLLRPAREGDPYIVLTHWRAYEDFKAWTQSEAFREGHAKSGTLPKAAFDRPNKLEIHQVVLDSREPTLEVDAPLQLQESAHA
jgi:heme-degrading monooxygenase HmoA